MSVLPKLREMPARAPMTKGAPKWREAHLYKPTEALETAIQVAMDLSQPLLLTGEPGSGKTAAAYWTAWRMGLSPDDLLFEQVRSDATAARLRYEFDAVSYFRESQASAVRGVAFDDDRRRFIRPGVLWRAFEATRTPGRCVVLVLDEIDKAPRDLPNDLLLEFDEQRFTVPDLPATHADHVISTRTKDGDDNPGRIALTVFTSNAERKLPDAFLRRCVHHHIRIDEQHLRAVLETRRAHHTPNLDGNLVKLAIDMLLRLRAMPLQHTPGTAELLTWLRVVAGAGNVDLKLRNGGIDLRELPYLGTLLKDPADHELVQQQG